MDYKTRRYIDDLRQRNFLLESAMRELKRQILVSVEMQPLDVVGMNSAVPEGDASMAIQENQSLVFAPEMRDTLKQLLDDLVHRVPGVETFKGKGIRLRTGEGSYRPLTLHC